MAQMQLCCCKVTAMKMMVDRLAGAGADFVIATNESEGGRSNQQQLLLQLPPQLLHRLLPNLHVAVVAGADAGILRHLPLPLHMPLHLRLHMWILYLNPKWIAAQPGGSDASGAEMIADGGDAATT